MSRASKTPSEMRGAQRCDSAVAAHPCSNVIPFYPVRYSVRPATGSGYDYVHPNLRNDLPPLKDTVHVLRLLRPGSWLYVYDGNNRNKLVCFLYDTKDESKSQDDVEGLHFYRVDLNPESFAHTVLTGALSYPYIPAPEPKLPPAEIAVLLTDAPLSPARLKALKENAGGLRDRSMQRIDLTPWREAFKKTVGPEAVPDTPAVKDTLPVLELARQVADLRGTDLGWSEHAARWSAQALHSCDARMRQEASGAMAGTRLAIVFDDPIGALSELNYQVNRKQAVLAQFQSVTERPLRVAKWVHDLGEVARKKGEENARRERMVASARRGAHTMGPDYERQRGQQAQQVRLLDIREAERIEFLKTYQTDLADHTTRVSEAGQRAADWLQARSNASAYEAALALYDPADDIGHCALRGAVARTYDFAIVHEPTGQKLAETLKPSGPTSGVFKDLMMGHAALAAWVNLPKAEEFGSTKVLDANLNALRKLIHALPADSASARLSLIMAVLLSRHQKVTPEAYWASSYSRAMQAYEGVVIGERRLRKPDEVAQWLAGQRRELQQAHWRGQPPPPQPPHRAPTGPANRTPTVKIVQPDVPPIAQKPPMPRTQVSMAVSEALDFRFEVELEKEGNAELERIGKNEAQSRNSLRWKVSMWSQAKLAVGGLGLWVSMGNVAESAKKLSRTDAQLVAESFGMAGDLLGVGAGGSALTQTAYEWRRDMAALRGNQRAMGVLQGLADKWERRAIGVAGAAAAMYAIRDGLKAKKEWNTDGKAAGITALGAGVQLSAAVIASSWVAGHMNTKLIQLGIGAAARVGAGPIGWGLFALEMTYTGVTAWRDWTETENHINTWLAKCYWGSGKRTGSTLRHVAGTWLQDEVGQYPTGRDESHAYLALHHLPRIQTTAQLDGVFLDTVLPGELGDRADERKITVTFPGWRPDSRFRIVQYRSPRESGKPQTFEDPTSAYSMLKMQGTDGVVTISANDLTGDTEVTWWPGGAGGDDLSFTASN